MLTPDKMDQLKEVVANATSILVVFPTTVSLDQAASATALALGLETLGKTVSLLSPEKPAEKLNTITGISRTATQLGNKNLEVIFDYEEEMVDRVSYNIDEDNKKFHLVIQPKKGAKPLSSEGVEFTYSGAEADLIFLVAVGDLDSLDQLYIGYEDFYTSTTTVSLHTYETSFGTVKLDMSGSASFSEGVAYILQELGVELSGDVSTDLLMGVESATDSFRSLSATADTFEIASKLLRSGARRVRVPQNNGFSSSFANLTGLSAPQSSSVNGFASALGGGGAGAGASSGTVISSSTKPKTVVKKKPVSSLNPPVTSGMEGSGARG